MPFHLRKETVEAVVHAYATGATLAAGKVTGMTPQSLAAALQAYRKAFIDALRGVYIAAACFAVVAAVGKYCHHCKSSR
jgi:hypothetical protein